MRLLILVALVIAPAAAMAETVYKSLDAQGNVTYSQVPPENGRDVQALRVPSGPSPAQHDAATVRAKQIEQAAARVDRQLARRKAARSAREQRIADAKAEVAAAQDALAQSRVKRRIDYRGLNPRNRLKKSYYDRVRLHEQQVADARQRLRQVEAAAR